jgi:hypothetical protein
MPFAWSAQCAVAMASTFASLHMYVGSPCPSLKPLQMLPPMFALGPWTVLRTVPPA